MVARSLPEDAGVDAWVTDRPWGVSLPAGRLELGPGILRVSKEEGEVVGG